VVHLHSSKAGLAGRLALRGRTPTIFQTHAWSFLALDRPMATLAIAWERWAVRWAAAVVCCSKGEAELGRAAGITGALVVVPNAVDTSLVLRDEAARSARRSLRTELGIGDAPLAVCIGRLSRQKGQDVLLQAWPAVRAAVPDARLALVGEGPDRPDLTALLSAGAEMVGHRSDIGAWLAAADVVAVPSRYDTMPLTLLEALAVGRSVVVSDAPGVAEAIEGADSPAGAIVPVGSTAALSSALADRLEDADLRAAEGRAARVHADREHSLTRWLDQLAELAEYVSVSAPGAAAPAGR
jgi:glycosyltransferase involved in cell wall biosynthesis